MNWLTSLTNVFKKKEKAVETIQENLEPKEKHGENWGGGRKLNEEQQLQMVNYIAQGLTAHQIVEKFNDEYDIKISSMLISIYRGTEKWQPKILELRQQYLDRLDLIDGSHKAVRIRRMEHIMDKAVQKGDLRVALSANEQTRKEFQSEDGQTTVYWNNPVYQQFNQLSNEDLLKKQKEATEKLKIKKES